MATDFTRLRVIPLFSSLKDADLNWLGGLLKQTSYPANEVIVTQGDAGETFYLIAAGQVRLVREDAPGARRVIRLLGPGQFFGEASLLYGEPRIATVEAASPTTLFFVEQEDFDAMIRRLPGVRKQLEETAGIRSKALGLDRFDWQDHDEIVLWVAHRNVIPLIFESAGGLIFWHFIAGVLAVLSFVKLPLIGLLPGGWQWALRAIAFLIVSPVWIWYIVDWTNDYLVLTNRRVIHFERYGIFRETREEIPIQAVQNVDLARTWPTSLIGLADISVKTIGGALTFTHIAEAEHLAARILDQRTLAQEAVRREDREEVRQTLLKVLKPESLAVPPPPSPPSPDALAALAQIKPKKPPKPPLRERWRALRQMRIVQGEEITWRKHWLVLLERLSGPIFLALVALALPLVTWALRSFSLLSTFPPLAIWIPVVTALVAVLWGWWEFLVWGGDIYTLTANRIVDIARLPLGLRETRRESGLDRIQDIDVSVPNIVARMFGMGDVYIKTGAAGSDLTFQSVADPYSVQRDIFHQLAALRRREERQHRQQTMDEISRWLTVYNELTTKTAKSSGTGSG